MDTAVPDTKPLMLSCNAVIGLSLSSSLVADEVVCEEEVEAMIEVIVSLECWVVDVSV